MFHFDMLISFSKTGEILRFCWIFQGVGNNLVELRLKGAFYTNKGPVKLTQQVKIAHSFLKSV